MPEFVQMNLKINFDFDFDFELFTMLLPPQKNTHIERIEIIQICADRISQKVDQDINNWYTGLNGKYHDHTSIGFLDFLFTKDYPPRNKNSFEMHGG